MLTVKGVVLEGPKNEKAINGYSELLGLSKHPKNLEPYHDDNYRDAATDSSVTEDTKKEIRYPVSSEYLAKFKISVILNPYVTINRNRWSPECRQVNIIQFINQKRRRCG